MIITCPACTTHFMLHAGTLGRAGKQVRCFNCGTEWLQRPVAEARLVRKRARPKPPPAPIRRPVRVRPAPAMAAAPAAVAAPAYVPEVAQPEPVEEDALEAAMARAAAATEARPRPRAPAPGPDDDRIAAALEKEAAPEFMGSLDGSPADSAPDNETLDTIGEPDPIPEVFTTEPGEAIPGKVARTGPGAIMGWVGGAVVLFLIGGGLFFGRDVIVGLWPGANSLYAMVGLGGDVLGSGLEVRNMRTARETEDGADVVVVRGVIHNISHEGRRVPFIRVTLHDANGEEVMSQVLSPIKADLAAGEDMGFRALFQNPPGTARRAGVDWTDQGGPAMTPGTPPRSG